MEPRDLNRMFDALAPTADQEQAVLNRSSDLRTGTEGGHAAPPSGTGKEG